VKNSASFRKLTKEGKIPVSQFGDGKSGKFVPVPVYGTPWEITCNCIFR
jgi:hypothetical protein